MWFALWGAEEPRSNSWNICFLICERAPRNGTKFAKPSGPLPYLQIKIIMLVKNKVRRKSFVVVVKGISSLTFPKEEKKEKKIKTMRAYVCIYMCLVKSPHRPLHTSWNSKLHYMQMGGQIKKWEKTDALLFICQRWTSLNFVAVLPLDRTIQLALI